MAGISLTLWQLAVQGKPPGCSPFGEHTQAFLPLLSPRRVAFTFLSPKLQGPFLCLRHSFPKPISSTAQFLKIREWKRMEEKRREEKRREEKRREEKRREEKRREEDRIDYTIILN